MSGQEDTQGVATKAPRKFNVEPLESTKKSNRGGKTTDTKDGSSKPTRRFAPQPVETSSKSSRRHGDGKLSKESSSSAPATPAGEAVKKAPRKFAPQLIETTTRTRKRGDTVPASRQVTDKTDLSPGDPYHLPRHMRLERPSALPTAPENTPIVSTEHVPQSKFSSANLAKRQARRTSFRAPSLDPIESNENSDESGQSGVPSLSTSPSANSEPHELRKHVSRLRESCDDRFSGYLLALAARVAEQQLKEQAMAAYPNERLHEPVDHFANVDRDSDENDEETGFGMLSDDDGPIETKDRRESVAGWELADMRKHQANLEQQRKDYKEKEEASHRPAPAQNPFKSPFGALPDIAPAKPAIGGPVKGGDDELKKMRSAASPPMLGKDITFRSCPSPKQTMMDPTQRPRRQDSSEEAPISRQHSGLWTPTHSISAATTPKNLSRKPSATGLWHGVCHGTSGEHNSLAPPGINFQTGLMTPALYTPAAEQPDPFASLSISSDKHHKHQLPSTPPPSAGGKDIRISSIDDMLTLESALDTEFPDSFVTQVYNYLSLGYPALARAYDHELSKISRVPVQDIRRDDARRNTKGFVGAPEGEGCSEEEIKEACGRWRALRLYVREWGRQEGRMVAAKTNGLPEGTWGQAVRRGSWAI